MLKWAIILAIVALIAAALGFTGLAGAAAGVAKILFFLFLVGFVLVLLLGGVIFKGATKYGQASGGAPALPHLAGSRGPQTLSTARRPA